jgi:hypothetical protein
MAIGSVNTALHLTSLPHGLTFTVTELKSESRAEWRAFFDGPAKAP